MEKEFRTKSSIDDKTFPLKFIIKKRLSHYIFQLYDYKRLWFEFDFLTLPELFVKSIHQIIWYGIDLDSFLTALTESLNLTIEGKTL